MELVLISYAIFASLVLLAVTLIFVLSRLFKDNSLIDMAYGMIFSISAIATMWLTGQISNLTLIITGCLLIWSVRLSGRITIKNWGKPEDFRYRKWREVWSRRGRLYFILRSLLQINLLQGVIIVLVASPFVIAFANVWVPLNPLFLGVGLVVFMLGLGFESVADWQLDRFLAKKKRGETEATLLTTGLFRYSRRPNYFGETLIWWGLAIMVAPLPLGWLAFVSPLLITVIVTKVTGPMLEQKFLEMYPEQYREYMSQTSYFFPLPPRP